jgi:hypothetical protein
VSESRPGIRKHDGSHGGYILENESGEVVALNVRLWKRSNMDDRGRTVLYDADETEYVPAKRLGRVRLRS